MGCTNGAPPNDHGIIYHNGSQPMLLRGEPELGFSPIRFHPSLHERIGEEARVDYSRLVTVEHNVAVSFIGAIAYKDRKIVEISVDDCWDRKQTYDMRLGTKKAAASKSGPKLRIAHSGHRSDTDESVRYSSAHIPPPNFGSTGSSRSNGQYPTGSSVISGSSVMSGSSGMSGSSVMSRSSVVSGSSVVSFYSSTSSTENQEGFT